MQQVQGELAAGTGHIRSRLAELAGEADSLGRMWEGESQSVFERGLRRELVRLSGVCESLEKLTKYEEQAATVYGRCINRTRQIIAAIE